MPFWRLYYHLVWATKNREPLITPQLETRLYAYMVNKAAELGAYTYAINGGPEHTHMVVASPPDVALSRLVQEVKGASSHDLNQQNIGFKFAWQRGYGALSLGQKQLDEAITYVNRQKEHHSNLTVHPWLERYSEIDEGPDDHGLGRSRVPALREEGVSYDYLGEPLF
jgi:REP element-mobilizing transposase RayT